jgi:hypothetical protein
MASSPLIFKKGSDNHSLLLGQAPTNSRKANSVSNMREFGISLHKNESQHERKLSDSEAGDYSNEDDSDSL